MARPPWQRIKDGTYGILAVIILIVGVGVGYATSQFGQTLDMASNKITSLATPTASTDAATKGYVDGLVEHTQSSVFYSTGTFTVPTGVTMVWVTMWGGGGGGGGGSAFGQVGGGGGSSEAIVKYPLNVTAGTGYTVTIGGAGGGGASGVVGSSGGDTTFGGLTASGGGGGGPGSGAPGVGGKGGGGMGGAGASGANGVSAPTYAYGMGGAGGGESGYYSGAFGHYAAQVNQNGAPGFLGTGTNSGAGGSGGAANSAGSAGQAGGAIISWVG